MKVWTQQASEASAAGRGGGGRCGCWLLTLTFLHKAAQVLVLLPDDPLQPLGLVEVGETSQSAEEDWTEQRSHGCWTFTFTPKEGFLSGSVLMLTVFHEEVDPGLLQRVSKDVLVDLHHVGAEDPLVAAYGHVSLRGWRVAL